MKLRPCIALLTIALLMETSLAVAQQTPRPVVRTGNFIEVANDVFMHIIAVADMRCPA